MPEQLLVEVFQLHDGRERIVVPEDLHVLSCGRMTLNLPLRVSRATTTRRRSQRLAPRTRGRRTVDAQTPTLPVVAKSQDARAAPDGLVEKGSWGALEALHSLYPRELEPDTIALVHVDLLRNNPVHLDIITI